MGSRPFIYYQTWKRERLGLFVNREVADIIRFECAMNEVNAPPIICSYHVKG